MLSSQVALFPKPQKIGNRFSENLIESVGEGQKGGNAKMCNNTEFCFFLHSPDVEMSP